MTTSKVAQMLVHPRLKTSDIERGDAYSVQVEFNTFEPSRQTLVLIHGYLGNLDDWEPAFERLNNTFNLIAVELRGHGGSHYPLEEDVSWGMSDLARDVVEVVQLIAPETSFSIMASSMGTAIAFEVARLKPELVNRLFLMSPTSKFSVPFWVKLILGIGKMTSQKFTEGVVDMVTSIISKFASDQEKEFWEDGIERFQTIDIEIHQKLISEALAKWEVDTTGIDIPVLIVAGKKDNVVAYEDTVDLLKSLPNGALLTLEDEQHHIVLKRKDIVFDLIVQWMKHTDEVLKKQFYDDQDIQVNKGLHYLLPTPVKAPEAAVI